MYENPLDPRAIPSSTVPFPQAGPLGIIIAFTKKINIIVLGPVIAITAAFIMGITDSGWAADLFSFLSSTLADLETYSYKCAKVLPDIGAYFACFK